MSRGGANAFPSALGDPGLTVREHFAALFTQAVIAKNPPCGEFHADMNECDKPALYARAGVLYADALIAELAKPAAVSK